MTTKRKTGFTKITLPNSPSSGVTVGFTLSFPLDGARVGTVTLPVLPCVNIASGPAALFAEQLEQSTTSRATRINRTRAVNEFGGGTSTGKTRISLFDLLPNLFPAFVPVRPTLSPGLAGEILSRLGQEFFHNLQLALDILSIVPLEIPFQQAKMVLRIMGRQLNRTLQVLPRLAPAADARRPARRLKVEQTKVSVRPGVVELRVEVACRFEFTFHFLNDSQRAKRFGLRQLAEVHREVIMAGDRLRIARHQLPTGGDALVGDQFTLIVVFREVRPVEASATELPRCLNVIGAVLKFFSRLLIILFRAFGEGRIVFAEAKPDGCEQPEDAEAPTTRSRSRFPVSLVTAYSP